MKIAKLLLTVGLLWGPALQAELAPLPEPLSLPEALRLTHAQQPLLLQAQAGQAMANAGALSSDALYGTRLIAIGKARWIDPSSLSNNDDRNDSSAVLSLQKRLYDFGYRDKLAQQASEDQAVAQAQLQHAAQQVRLRVMRAYFDVILADIEFARDNEAMAIAFIRSDRVRDRAALGQYSDVDVLEAEADFEDVRRARFASENRQRLMRSRLAIAMGRPEDLASNLVTPNIDLPEADRNADFFAYWEQVMQRNPELQALRARKAAAQQQVQVARAANGAVLSGTLDASVYNRETGSTHPLAAGLLLEIPLLDGGDRDAAIAKAQAEVTSAEAALLQRQLSLRDEALGLWLAQNDLRADVQAFEKRADYRDLYLDRSRALYELEVKTDLGDAMTQTTDVRLKLHRALFNWAMNEAQRKALLGELQE